MNPVRPVLKTNPPTKQFTINRNRTAKLAGILHKGHQSIRPLVEDYIYRKMNGIWYFNICLPISSYIQNPKFQLYARPSK